LQLQSKPRYERVLAYTFTKIWQWAYLSTIPVAVLLLAVILPWRGFVPYQGSITEGIVVFYICSFISVLLGYKWPKWFPWYRWYPTENVGIFFSHIFRIITFVLPIGSGFFLGILGGSWAVRIPLFALGGISLFLTFPTDKKVDKWKTEQSPKS
jgi:hypothetical protein